MTHPCLGLAPLNLRTIFCQHPRGFAIGLVHPFHTFHKSSMSVEVKPNGTPLRRSKEDDLDLRRGYATTMKNTYLSRCLWCVRCLRQGIPWRQDPQNSHFRVARTREVLGNSTVVAVASGCRTQSKIYAAVCVCVRMCRYGVCVYIHPVYTYTSVCVCVCVCMHLCVCCVYTKHGEWRHGLHQQ